MYKLKQLDEKEILSIIATRKDTLAFSSIVQEDNAKPSKNLANLDEILVKPWQIVCKGQKSVVGMVSVMRWAIITLIIYWLKRYSC